VDYRPFKLLLEIDGLCAFVPAENRRSMTLVFVNGAGGASMQGVGYNGHAKGADGCSMQGTSDHGYIHGGPMHGAAHGHAPSHYAFIKFQQRTLCNLQDHHRQIRLGRSTFVRFFDWEDLRIIRRTLPPEPYLRIANGRRPGSAEPANRREARDFSWLAEIDKIHPAAGRINPACLAPDPPRNLVIGRVFFDDGEIRTETIARDAHGLPILWEFRTIDDCQTSHLCQVLVSKIIYELEIWDESVTLRFSRYNRACPVDFEFKPDPESGLNEVKIVLANRPLEEIVGLDGYTGTYMDPLAHFGLLYRLAEKQPATVFIPYAVSHPGFFDGGLVRGGNTLCLGGTYSGG
jgi:hypothetical protein